MIEVKGSGPLSDMKMASPPTSWTKYFFVYWIAAAITLYIVWVVSRERFIDVMGLYMVSTVAAVTVAALREQKNLMRYLKCFHVKKWEEITSFPLLGGGPGGRNSFRGFRFVYGDDYLNDSVVKSLKHNFKSITPWVLVVPISHVGLILLMTYLGILRHH